MQDRGAAGDILLPGHAYVPGKSARHPPAAFAALRAGVEGATSAEELAHSKTWHGALLFLDAGYFWEAHELFEPIWHALPQNAPERQLVRALIQAANAGLKFRMGRPRAARRLLALAKDLFDGCRMQEGHARRGAIMGLEADDVAARFARIARIASELP